MIKRIQAWLELIRLPNLFTVPGDVIAGGLLSGKTGLEILPYLFVSLLLYSVGIILNDVADFREDRETRPLRPLPSGRISVRSAKIVAGVLIVLAIALVFVFGEGFGSLMFPLLACILVYTLGWRSIWLLAVCRGLNVLLPAGVSGVNAEVLSAAGVVAVFVLAVSLLAKFETKKRKLFPLTYLPAVVLAVSFAAMKYWFHPVQWFHYAGIAAVFRMLAVGVELGHEPEPAAVQKAVGYWLCGLPLIQGILILAVPGVNLLWVLGVLSLWTAASLSVRKFYAS